MKRGHPLPLPTAITKKPLPPGTAAGHQSGTAPASVPSGNMKRHWPRSMQKQYRVELCSTRSLCLLVRDAFGHQFDFDVGDNRRVAVRLKTLVLTGFERS